MGLMATPEVHRGHQVQHADLARLRIHFHLGELAQKGGGLSVLQCEAFSMICTFSLYMRVSEPDPSMLTDFSHSHLVTTLLSRQVEVIDRDVEHLGREAQQVVAHLLRTPSSPRRRR